MASEQNAAWLKAIFGIVAGPALTIVLCFSERSYDLYKSGVLLALALLVVASQVLGAIWLYRLVRQMRPFQGIIAFIVFAVGPIWTAGVGEFLGAPVNVHGMSMPVLMLSAVCAWGATLCAIAIILVRRFARR